MSSSGVAAGGPPTGAAGGDIAGTGASTYPNPTLTAIGAAAGPIGSSTVTPVVTIDAKGRVIALTSAASGGAGILTASVTLNAAAIATLFSAPTTLVAAPGANRSLVVVGGFAQYKPASGGWTAAPAADVHLRAYYGPTGPAGDGTQASCLLDACWLALPPTDGSQTMSIVAQADDGTEPNPLANVANAPLIVSGVTDPLPIGPIVTATKQAGGALYAAGDTGTIAGPLYGSAATYVVDTVDGGGAVLTFHVTGAGTGYATGFNPVATAVGGAQPGLGTGFTVNITAVTAPVGTISVTVYYATAVTT